MRGGVDPQKKQKSDSAECTNLHTLLLVLGAVAVLIRLHERASHFFTKPTATDRVVLEHTQQHNNPMYRHKFGAKQGHTQELMEAQFVSNPDEEAQILEDVPAPSPEIPTVVPTFAPTNPTPAPTQLSGCNWQCYADRYSDLKEEFCEQAGG